MLKPTLTLTLDPDGYSVAKLEANGTTHFTIVAPGGLGMVKAPDADKAKGFPDYLGAQAMASALNDQAKLAPLMDGPAPKPNLVPMVLPCVAGWQEHLRSLTASQVPTPEAWAKEVVDAAKAKPVLAKKPKAQKPGLDRGGYFPPSTMSPSLRVVRKAAKKAHK